MAPSEVRGAINGSQCPISIAPGFSIQKAIDTAPGTSSIIVLEPGTYTENIIMRSGITITSGIKHKAIIKPKNNSKYTVNGWGVSNIVISNLIIEGGIEIGQVTTDFSRVSTRLLLKITRSSTVIIMTEFILVVSPMLP